MISYSPDSQHIKPFVAVLLAAFNGARWLPDQIHSILNQAGVQVTIYISVDKSSDGTESWVDALAKQSLNVKILPHGKKFGGAAPNFFRLISEVDFSCFDFVALADQDDIWLPNKLIHAIEVLGGEKSDIYSSDVTAFWPDGKKMTIKKSQPQVEFDYLFEAAGPGCTYVFTKRFAVDLQFKVLSLAKDINKIDLHDWFIYAYARTRNYTWKIDDLPLIYYRQHEKNQVGANIGVKAYVYRFKKVFSGWLFDQSRLIAQMIGLSESTTLYRWSSSGRLGYLKLGFNAHKCRRRSRDQIVFACMCLILAVLGNCKN